MELPTPGALPLDSTHEGLRGKPLTVRAYQTLFGELQNLGPPIHFQSAMHATDYLLQIKSLCIPCKKKEPEVTNGNL